VLAALALIIFLTNSDDGRNDGTAGTHTGQIAPETGTPNHSSDTTAAERTTSPAAEPLYMQDTVFRTLWSIYRDDRELFAIEYEAVSHLKKPVGISGIFMEEGFLFEITHSAVVGNVLYLYFTLEDFVGGRLNEFTQFFVNMLPKNSGGGFGNYSSFASKTGFNENGVPTFRSRFFTTSLIETQEFLFTLSAIYHSHRFAEYDLEIDFSALTPVEAAGYVDNTPILQPHTDLFEITQAAFELSQPQYLSAVGIIDGLLHVQSRLCVDPLSLIFQTGSRVAHIFLIDPAGEVVFPRIEPEPAFTAAGVTSVNFRVDNFGYINPRDIFGFTGHNLTTYVYQEEVFDVDLDRLSEYRLVASFRSESTTTLNWETDLKVYASENFGISTEVNDVEFFVSGGAAVTVEKVIVVPAGVIIRADMSFEGFRMSNSPALRDIEINVHTSDGVIQTYWGSLRDNAVAVGGGVIVNEFSLFYMVNLNTGFLDIDSVISVDINGHTIQIAH